MDEWLRIDVRYDPLNQEIVWACLYRHECLGLEENRPGACRAYFPFEVTPDCLLSELRACSAVLQAQHSTLRAEDWHSRWMENYHSFQIGAFLVRPTWETATVEPDLLELVMDPQGAFGTGTHETTQLCLKFLPRLVSGRRTALDLGCGSGILSVALRKLAPQLELLALDNDFEACQVCRGNREINRVRFSIACGEINATRDLFDLVVANLQMDLLLRLLPDFLSRSASGAMLLLSGVLEEQVAELRRVYDASLQLQHVETQGEWAALLYLRP